MSDNSVRLNIFMSMKKDLKESLRDLRNDISFIDENINNYEKHTNKVVSSNVTENLSIKLYKEQINIIKTNIEKKEKVLSSLNKTIDSLCDHKWQIDNSNEKYFYQCKICGMIQTEI